MPLRAKEQAVAMPDAGEDLSTHTADGRTNRRVSGKCSEKITRTVTLRLHSWPGHHPQEMNAWLQKSLSTQQETLWPLASR
jgi:hypothetical protein